MPRGSWRPPHYPGSQIPDCQVQDCASRGENVALVRLQANYQGGAAGFAGRQLEVLADGVPIIQEIRVCWITYLKFIFYVCAILAAGNFYRGQRSLEEVRLDPCDKTLARLFQLVKDRGWTVRRSPWHDLSAVLLGTKPATFCHLTEPGLNGERGHERHREGRTRRSKCR